MRKGALRHASIKTTADVYMQEIPASVRAAINSRTRAVLDTQRMLLEKSAYATRPNVSKSQEGRSCKCLKRMAPQVGLTTLRLTAS